MFVHFASFSAPNFSFTLPVLVTVILYRIVWPTSPVSVSFVKPLPLPLISCSLTIVNSSFFGIVTCSTAWPQPTAGIERFFELLLDSNDATHW